MLYSLRKRNRKYVNLVELLEKPRSIKTGGGVIKFIKHKIFMRKIRKQWAKVDKADIRFQRIEDQGKEMLKASLTILEEIRKAFNDLNFNIQVSEILKYNKEEAIKKHENLTYIDNEIFKRRLDKDHLKANANSFIDRFEDQSASYEQYKIKLEAEIQVFKEELAETERLIRDYRGDIKIKQQVQAELEQLSELSKSGKRERREVANYKKDYDELERYSYEEIQKKAATMDSLIYMQQQTEELMRFYKTLREDQRKNLESLVMWLQYLREFYIIINFINVKEWIDAINAIRVLIGEIINIYRLAHDSKINTYVKYYEQYNMRLEECERDLKIIKDKVDDIKTSYFTVGKEAPILQPASKIAENVYMVINVAARVYKRLFEFYQFIIYYKDERWNAEVDDKQSGGSLEHEIQSVTGKFTRDMLEAYNTNHDSTNENDMNPIIREYINHIFTTASKTAEQPSKYFLDKFNKLYYVDNDKLCNKVGFYKLLDPDDKPYLYTYMRCSQDGSYTPDKSNTLDLMTYTGNTDLEYPGLIKVVTPIITNPWLGIYLYYPGKSMICPPSLHSNIKTQHYLFYCVIYSDKADKSDLSVLDASDRAFLLDAFTGYPIMNIGDQVFLLREDFIYDVIFKRANDKAEFELKLSNFTKGCISKNYSTLQLAYQAYSDIFEVEKTHPYIANLGYLADKLLDAKHSPNTRNRIDVGDTKFILPSGTACPLVDESKTPSKEDLVKAERLAIRDKLLYGYDIPIKLEPVIAGFSNLTSIERLEEEIKAKLKSLLKMPELKSSSSRKSIKKLSERKSELLIDNLNLLESALKQLVLIEKQIKEFGERAAKEIYGLTMDLSKTREQRIHELKPELTAQLKEAAERQYDADIMREKVEKGTTQSKFEEYIKEYFKGDYNEQALKLKYADTVLEPLKGMDDVKFKKFYDYNFIEGKSFPNFQDKTSIINTFIIRLSRALYVQDMELKEKTREDAIKILKSTKNINSDMLAGLLYDSYKQMKQQQQKKKPARPGANDEAGDQNATAGGSRMRVYRINRTKKLLTI